MATGTTRRTELNTISKEPLLWPKITDPDTLSADLHAMARALENDAETGQGKLSERPAAALRGRFFFVTEGEEKGLYWDTGTEWVSLGQQSSKSIIETEEARQNTAYGTLPTPDEVEVALPADGLISVAYQAQWAETVADAARAAIFLGTHQLKVQSNGSPVTTAACTNGSEAGIMRSLVSFGGGIGSMEAGGIEDVTTGQVVGAMALTVNQSLSGNMFLELGGSTFVGLPGNNGGPSGTGNLHAFTGGACLIFAAAGTYKLSVQFKASSGKVIAKNRKLWAWVIG